MSVIIRRQSQNALSCKMAFFAVAAHAVLASDRQNDSSCQAVMHYDVELGPGYGPNSGDPNFNGTVRIKNQAQVNRLKVISVGSV